MKNSHTNNFRDLRVWNNTVDLAVTVYRLTEEFPDRERFGLSFQLRKSAVSVPSNIAEGNARLTTPDYLRHLSISRGSLAEFDTQIEIARRISYLEASDADALQDAISTANRQLQALIQSLQRKLGR